MLFKQKEMQTIKIIQKFERIKKLFGNTKEKMKSFVKSNWMYSGEFLGMLWAISSTIVDKNPLFLLAGIWIMYAYFYHRMLITERERTKNAMKLSNEMYTMMCRTMDICKSELERIKNLSK